MQDLPGNSNNQQHKKTEQPTQESQEEPRVKRIVEGTVITRKPSRWKRFTESFTGNDGQTIPQFIMHEIVAPMTRDMLFAVVNNGSSRILYGDSHRRPGPQGYGTGPMYQGQGPMAYNRQFNGPVSPTISQQGRRMHNFSEVLIPQRHTAEDVRTIMYELIDQYGWARVSDFYAAVGITPNPQDNKFGWNDLRGCKIRPVGGGYVIDLPMPTELPR